MKLATTDTQVLALQQVVNEARESSEAVKVSKAALRNLLLDHHAMVDKLNPDTER